MGLSFMKCGKVTCEKARVIGQDFCEEHQPAEPQGDAPTIRCRDCGGTLIWEKTAEGYEVIHSCHAGKQVREMVQAAEQRATQAASKWLREMADKPKWKGTEGSHALIHAAEQIGDCLSAQEAPSFPQRPCPSPGMVQDAVPVSQPNPGSNTFVGQFTHTTGQGKDYGIPEAQPERLAAPPTATDYELFLLACKLVDSADSDRKTYWVPALSDLCRAVVKQHEELFPAAPPPLAAPPLDKLNKDARRYWRLRVLGAALCDSKELREGNVLRFTNLDEALDDDIRINPSRGEAELYSLVAVENWEPHRGQYVWVEGKLTENQPEDFPKRLRVYVHGVGTGITRIVKPVQESAAVDALIAEAEK